MALRAAASCYRVTPPQRVTCSSGHPSQIVQKSACARYSSNIQKSFQKVDSAVHSRMQKNLLKYPEDARFTKEKVVKMLSFEEFITTHKIINFEEYRQLPHVKVVTKGDEKETRIAYEDYCKSKYRAYQQKLYGGNPATMI